VSSIVLIDYNHNKPLYIIGDGVVTDGLVEYIQRETYSQVKAITKEEFLTLDADSQCIVGFWNFEYRKNFFSYALTYPRKWPIYIHKDAFVADSAQMGRGTVIYPMASILNSAVINDFGLIGCNTHIGHGTNLGNNNILAPGTIIGGSTRTGNNIYYGMSSSVKDKLLVCDNVKFNMTSRVTKDVLEPGTYFNNRKLHD